MTSKQQWKYYLSIGGVLTFAGWQEAYIDNPPTYMSNPIETTRAGYTLYTIDGDGRMEFAFIPEYIPKPLVCQCGNDTFSDTNDHELKVRRIVCKECSHEMQLTEITGAMPEEYKPNTNP